MRAWAASIATLAASGCSILLTYPEANQPCTPGGACLEGYACLDSRCVAYDSVAQGLQCAVTAHCQGDLVCAATPDLTCRKPCTATYGDHAECADGRACVRAEEANGTAIAVCQPSNCGDSCPPNAGPEEACVAITATAGVCIDACDLACSGGSCSGNCAAVGNVEQACQPLGSQEIMACIEAGSATHGQTCDLYNQLCSGTHACMKPADGTPGFCLKYCVVDADCAGLTDPASGIAAECEAHVNFKVCGSLP